MKSCFFLELPRYTYRVNSKLFTEIKYLGTTYLYFYIKIAENNSLINNLSIIFHTSGRIKQIFSFDWKGR